MIVFIGGCAVTPLSKASKIQINSIGLCMDHSEMSLLYFDKTELTLPIQYFQFSIFVICENMLYHSAGVMAKYLGTFNLTHIHVIPNHVVWC